jgi:hypothetical protein
MIIKRTKQLGNFKRGINLYIPRRTSSAPVGIPVNNTSAVTISATHQYLAGTYTKVSTNGGLVAGYQSINFSSTRLFLNSGSVYLKDAGYNGNNTYEPFPFTPYGYILIPPNASFTTSNGDALSTETFWRLCLVIGVFLEEGDYAFVVQNGLTNPSADPTTIPTIGWSYNATITALPSQIPVESSNQVILNNGFQTYQNVFGGNYYINQHHAFGKTAPNVYYDGESSYIIYNGFYWSWQFDNNDNSYNILSNPESSDIDFILSQWSNDIVITTV